MSKKVTQQEIMEEESKQLLNAAIDERLNMTYEERIEAHENARQLMEDLKKAGESFRCKT